MKQKYIHPQTEIVKMLGEALMGDKASHGGNFGNAKEGFFDEVNDDNDFWIDNSSSKSIWED